MSTKMVPLRRIAHLVNGGTPTADEANWGGDVQWATPVDLARFDGSIIDITDRTLTRDGLRSGSNCVRVGSIILSTRAPIGYVVQTIGSMAFNQGCKGLELCPGIEPRYVRYWLWAHREVLQGMGSGSTFMELSSDQLLAFEIPDIAPTGQRRIADFLDDQVARIDNIIAARQKQLLLLDDFIGSLVEKEVAASKFPVLELRRLLLSPPDYGANEPAEHVDRRWPRYVRTTDIATDGRLRDDTFRSLAPDVAKPYLLEDGDLLFTRSGATVGKSFIYSADYGACAFAGYLIRVRLNKRRAIPHWIKLLTETRDYWQQIDQASIQATIPNVSADRYAQLLFPVPPVPEQITLVERFAETSQWRLKVAAELDHQIQLISELRRSLITAAVSGEFDVSSADGSQIPLGSIKDVPPGTSVQPAEVSV